MFDFLMGLFSKDLAMDLGTANSLIYHKGKGIVLNEASVVAVQSRTGDLIAVGNEAKSMLGRSNKDITVIRPLKDGVIADFDITNRMMRRMIETVYNRERLVSPRMIVCVPAGITSVEKKAVIDAAEQAGARQVFLIEEPMAAAIGAGLPIAEPIGNMVVDIGGGTTEVAVISLGGIAYAESVRVAGDEMNDSLRRYMRAEYNMLIGENLAEQLKIEIGSAAPLDAERSYSVRGRNLTTGIPSAVELRSEEVREAMAEPVNVIVEAVRRALDKTSPELITDIADRGIVLTGGGALLRNLDQRIGRETGLSVVVAEEPLTSVVKGTGWALEDIRTYQKVFVN